MKKIPFSVLQPITTISAVIALTLAAGAASRPAAKNVILLIGDGMGAAERQAAAYFSGHKLSMDQMAILGMITTDSANSLVTDSAAAGTVMATGYKTNNGMISVTPDGRSVQTILEKAESMGLSTGLVATSTITHATPPPYSPPMWPTGPAKQPSPISTSPRGWTFSLAEAPVSSSLNQSAASAPMSATS